MASSPPSRRTGIWWPAVLTVGFTIALTFATIELPYWLGRLADRWIDIPDYHPAIEPDLIESFVRSVRPIGYISLGAVVALIVVGFVVGRRAPSTLGAVLLFLPTFGSFAGSMFFLAGLGALRVLWLPAWERMLHLGDIAYLPYMAIVWPFWQLGIDLRAPVAYAAIAVGLLIFSGATLAWFLARSRGSHLADFWFYRFSRHPQYLGWIVWSYGVMLLAAQAPVPMAGSNPGASLPWVISTLVIVGVALAEEARMEKKAGVAYESYRSVTPFLLPLPAPMTRFLRRPLRLRTRLPRTASQILGTLAVCLVLTMTLSVPFVATRWPSGAGWSDWPSSRIEVPVPPPDVPITDPPADDE